MKCVWHPEQEAVSICAICGSVFCEDCKVVIDGRTYCSHCKTKPRSGSGRAGAATRSSVSLVVMIAAAAAVVFCVGWITMIVVAPALARVQSAKNLAVARGNVQIIARAIERYTAAHGSLPQDEAQLSSGSGAYLDRSYNEKTVGGYRYYISLHTKGYEILASPEKCHTTGSKVVMFKRGQALTTADCD